jgi:hypothetical protein
VRPAEDIVPRDPPRSHGSVDPSLLDYLAARADAYRQRIAYDAETAIRTVIRDLAPDHPAAASANDADVFDTEQRA